VVAAVAFDVYNTDIQFIRPHIVTV